MAALFSFFFFMAFFIVIALALYGVAIYNALINVKNNIKKAWGNIDVLLKQRHDEIPKLIKTCESYMQYEKDTLEKVVKLRQEAIDASDVNNKSAKEGQLSQALSSVFALAENYPELKSQELFSQLHTRISELESSISGRREFYNESVNAYNIRIESFPDQIVANFMNLTQEEMFKVAESEKIDPGINISQPTG